ncbi:MAG: acylphosphatase [Hyphomicrobiales bacterium]|nr:MAG: acylphosphatase [Hyphomicrobiales bacterium]
MSRSAHLNIRGRVQGVGYRDWAVRKARELSLDGWVRNRLDGSVEAVIAGNETLVAAMIAACHSGPPSAHVDTIDVSDWNEPVSRGFEFQRTG